MVKHGDFFEWAQLNGHLCGTSKGEAEASVDHGHDVVLEIDWQGALKIK